MGKIKWNTKGAEVDAVEPEERETFEPYEGPVPPNSSVLLCELKWARVSQFSTGTSGLKLLLEVAEPEASAKKRYNGCPLFENLVDADTQDWKIRQFLDAIGGTGKDWDNCVAEKDDKNNEVIVKFGRIKAAGLKLRVQTTREMYEGESRAKVGRYLPKSAGAATSRAANATEGGDDEPPF